MKSILGQSAALLTVYLGMILIIYILRELKFVSNHVYKKLSGYVSYYSILYVVFLIIGGIVYNSTHGMTGLFDVSVIYGFTAPEWFSGFLFFKDFWAFEFVFLYLFSILFGTLCAMTIEKVFGRTLSELCKPYIFLFPYSFIVFINPVAAIIFTALAVYAFFKTKHMNFSKRISPKFITAMTVYSPIMLSCCSILNAFLLYLYLRG